MATTTTLDTLIAAAVAVRANPTDDALYARLCNAAYDVFEVDGLYDMARELTPADPVEDLPAELCIRPQGWDQLLRRLSGQEAA